MADKPKLPSKLNHADESALQNTGAKAGRLLDIASSNLSESEIAALRAKALDARLELEVDAQRRDNKYYDAHRTAQDHIDTFNMLNKGGKLTSQKVVTDLETGAGRMKIESKSGATCFVASAAYGDPNHPDVMFLRHYRDTKLKSSVTGRAFIAFYWKLGPVLARLVSSSPVLQRISRSAIETIVRGLQQAWRK